MLFPSRLVQRFFPIVLAIMLLFFTAVYLFSVPFIKNKVYEIELNSNRLVLDNVYALADRMYLDTLHYREQTLEAHKKQLKVIVSMAEAYLDQVFTQVAANQISEAEARKMAFDMLRHFKSEDGNYLWISSYDYQFLSHPDDRFHQKDGSERPNGDGTIVLPEIVEYAVKHGEGFYQYRWNRLSENQALDKLSYVKNYPKWGFVMGSGVYLEDVDAEVERKKAQALDELRESFKALRVAKTGYLFVFDANRNMLIHPNSNIDGKTFHDLINPVSKRLIAQDLIDIADTGRELYYKWDKPEEPGNYIYEKLSLVRHVKGFDWYIGSSVYVDELKSSSEQLSERILLMALIALIVAVAMAFYFIYWVTNPIKKLADAALRVKGGELTVTAGFRRDDEIGILAQTFDDMVERVRDNIIELDEKVKSRTHALERSNQQLIESAALREEAQQALMLNEERQRLILDLLPAQVAYVDTQLRIEFVNRYYAESIGCSKQNLSGLYLNEVNRERYDIIKAQLDEALQGKICVKDYVKYRDGDEIILKRLFTPCRNLQGEVVGVLLVAFDISAEKKAEKTLYEAQRMSSVGQLAGGLAHDFNNLLSIILGNLISVSEQEELPEELQRYIKPSIRAAKRGADITHRLLAFSRRQPLAPMACDLNALLHDAITLLSSSLPNEVSIDFEPVELNALPFVDPGRLEDAIVNLVLNAREAMMPEGGTVRLQVKQLTIMKPTYMDEEVAAGDYIEISVSDTGCGFSEESMRLAFEPFYTTSRGGSGSGLGLSMVYGFVKQSNGYIAINSKEHEGATISILLPAIAIDSLSQQCAKSADFIPDTEGQLVLLVEDDEDLRQVVRAQLMSLGYNVIESGEPEEALELLGVLDKLDLLVSDIRLNSDTNGFDLADRFADLFPNGKVLLMSGYAYEEKQGRGTDKTYEILSKPFSIKDLKEQLIRIY